MQIYFLTSYILIGIQILFTILMGNNLRYSLNKYKRRRDWFRPSTALLIPCKGLELNFKRNISSFLSQDYDNVQLIFIVESQQDPAYIKLCELVDEFSRGVNSNLRTAKILVSGLAVSGSQKIHNLLYAYNQLPSDIEIVAFADSDICVKPNWLSHLVYPFHQAKNGASTGYRWFIPASNNLATLTLSALNAKVAQLLGKSQFNHTWGGSMAIRKETFDSLNISQIWSQTISDDYSLSYAVKKSGLRIAYVPACLAASYESTTFGDMFEFARRQFVITRISAVGSWCFGLFGSLYTVICLWLSLVVSVWSYHNSSDNFILCVSIFAGFFFCQLARAIFRQKMAITLLSGSLRALRLSVIVDLLFFWFFSIIMLAIILSSAFGRTIRWRGIRYKIVSPLETTILK